MKLVKRSLAMLLVAAMLLSFAACGAPKAQQEQTEQLEVQPEAPTKDQATDLQDMDRQDKELIAELVGGNQEADQLTDQELDQLIDQLVGEVGDEAASGVVNLSGNKEQPSVDVTLDPDAYDQDGAITKPFDQVYPELIEKEQVAFSGESILVKMRSNSLTDGLKAAGVGALEKIVPMEGCAWYEAKLTEGTDSQKALEAVRQLSEVMLAEFNYEVQTSALDDYKHFDKDKEEDFKKNGHNKDQWHFHYCGIPDGYEQMENDGGDKGVIVAVIDSGVDYAHEDLKDNMWVNTAETPDNGIDDDGNGYVDDYYGVDIIDKKGNGDDTNGHGTHVAGIIAARNNNVGVLGIAYNVKIMSVKAAAHNGTLNQADIAKAVLYAYENGAEVINMSFGGSASSIAVQDALQTAYTRCVLVASAGNNGENNEPTAADPIYLPNYPAALTYVLGVMSVDENGVESSFTNYDVEAFNGVEYELYAPGENIMSTLPGNKYGYLSGTSMAAPVVSAFAAILRGEFSDRDMYPTKFIYGQLASTSQIQADCLNPNAHGRHNLPQIADLNAALTKLPKPEVNLQDWAIFDDPKYSANNNGDGVIDAGETIALGLTLRNRWGMSENTLVTIDTLSTAGLSDPYITIKNPTVDFGSVGTYSTKDSGKIFTDELLTGWEEPFLVEISKDCPNDYRFTLNVTITCENALDDADTVVYTTKGAVSDAVRSGYILPSIIEEDMVLTKDNLYIIPNATVIQEGVTVRVEPGTHIQFWSNDAKDPYADSYIAYLLVKGNFLVEGTKEEPVYIYPSQLMDKYCVEFGSTNSGYISLKYADITNYSYVPTRSSDHTGTSNHIDLADHCTFRQNYSDYMYYRYLSGGSVYSSYDTTAVIGKINAKDCVFYKIAGYGIPKLNGTADRCIFVQCGISFNGRYSNCVFLKNNLERENGRFLSSSISVTEGGLQNLSADRMMVIYRPETGTTYAKACHSSFDRAFAAFMEQEFGGHYVKIEDEAEFNWLKESGILEYHPDSYSSASCIFGVKKAVDGKPTWYDGTPIAEFLLNGRKTYAAELCLDSTGVVSSLGNKGPLIEIPGQILPEEITFNAYTVDMDTESTYQLVPISTPVQLDLDGFLYESTNETVVTVSETGFVTPVGLGTADVWVYSLDRAVKNRVTFTVKDYVPLENITFVQDKAELAVGESLKTEAVLTPLDTTRNSITYTSGNEKVAIVDKTGVVTAVGSGSTTVTATCEGVSATLEVTAYVKATQMEMESIALTVALDDDSVELPGIVASEGAELALSWRSTDENVAVIENGKLVPKTLGTTSIVAFDSRSGLTAACLVIVTETAVAPVQAVETVYSDHYVLLENGDLYFWSDFVATPKRIATDVQTFDAGKTTCALLLRNGFIQRIHMEYYDIGAIGKTITDFSGQKISQIGFYGTGYNTNASYYVLTQTNNVYAFGGNDYGQLGVGTTETVNEPTLINLDGIVDMIVSETSAYFLTHKGELYGAGNLAYTQATSPILIATDVKQLCWASGYRCTYISEAEEWINFDGNNSGSSRFLKSNIGIRFSGCDAVALMSNYEGLCVQNGKVYVFDWNTSRKQVPGIINAEDVYTYDGTHYIVTEDGILLGLGNNSVGNNHMAGASAEHPVTAPVMIPLTPAIEETVAVQNTDDLVVEDSVELCINKALTSVNPKLYADGLQVTVQHAITDFNYLQISRADGFSEGVSYELVFEADTIQCVGGITNAEEIRIPFTYKASTTAAPEENDGNTEVTTPPVEPVIYESQVDESIVRVQTAQTVAQAAADWHSRTQYNEYFNGNAILNHISTDTDVSHWLRPVAKTVTAGYYYETPFGSNYWGSTNEKAIELQMVDYSDFITYYRLMYAPYLTQAPENTFPFVTDVKLINKDGDAVTTVGNEQITFRITFNRDMDTAIPLQVRFGSAAPYGDYEVAGQYVDARTWEGTYTLKTTIENGDQFLSIANGCSASDDLTLQPDTARFGFVIDTTAAQALIMQGTATDTGISLRWTQDDFKTLMGYNVYRATKEDGQYTRLNSTVIPADTMEWFDDTVEPGVVYYYNFTVVQTDLNESEPSGKIAIMSKDTMAPNIYHSPVMEAFTGSNLVLSATITDNLNIAYANLYYRTAGTDTWSIIRMNKLNDKYSAIIPASYITVAGVEYYIEAFDGVSYTYKASAEAPYTIAVQEALDADALGDVDGDGVITNLDALLLLYTINDKYNMTAEEFARADLNGDGELMAAEALRILQYVSGVVGSVKM